MLVPEKYGEMAMNLSNYMTFWLEHTSKMNDYHVLGRAGSPLSEAVFQTDWKGVSENHADEGRRGSQIQRQLPRGKLDCTCW